MNDTQLYDYDVAPRLSAKLRTCVLLSLFIFTLIQLSLVQLHKTSTFTIILFPVFQLPITLYYSSPADSVFTLLTTLPSHITDI